MKHTTSVSELAGHNESPVGGNFIVSSNRDFVTRHVVVGSSILYNKTKNLSGTVSAATSDRIDAPGVDFSPGDLFLITLDTDWILQTDDGPVIEVECNRCGWSFPQKQLSKGLCKDCIDQTNSV